jgi:hypothetical protein
MLIKERTMPKTVFTSELEGLKEDIAFLLEYKKKLEPLMNRLISDMVDGEQTSPERAFEMFKFITEYHTNATLLIIKAKEVLASNEQ